MVPLVHTKRLIISAFFVLFSAQSLVAEITWGSSIERGGGEFLFETGNRFPNLSGIRGGSRISFPRTFTQFGLSGLYFKDKWEARVALKSTGWTQNSGEARDEDFVMGNTSQENATKIATREFSYYDSGSVYSGTRNFADGKGKSSIRQDLIEGFGRFYFQTGSPDHWSNGSGFFLTSGLRYSYFKYLFYDVNQFVDSRPVFYGPIGLGLSYSNNLYELFYGVGYRHSIEKYYIDFAFMPSIGRIISRDYHVQRSINFLSDNTGFGWQSTLEGGYKLSDTWLSYLKISHRRFFSEGKFTARGGLTQEDIISNFSGGFKSHINIKDFSIELGFLNKIQWDTENATENPIK
ncbi:putative porin [Leptospira ognonensis]|uniref:Putative porin n=2 Tax=Leptospira ognonensis TaxID=2484945 RepID=A0A4R9K6T1_9LEPT|nr:putative porin [Leptospira ognonensis]